MVQEFFAWRKIMFNSLKVGSTALCLLAFVAIGCEKTEDVDNEAEQAAEPATMPAPIPDNTAAPAAPAVTQLEQKGNSGVTGEVSQTRTATDVTLEISLNGIKEGASYPAHIHTGTCATSGPVAVELNSITATGTAGQSTTTVEIAKVPAQAFVQVHDAAGTAIACSDLTTPAPTP
jgi:hypothetical protein